MTSVASSAQASAVGAAPTPRIAIIGTEGAGKTVLITALAKRLSTIDARGVFLNPQGVKTLKYVEGVWQTLQSGEWPPSTPPGDKVELRWKFQIVGEIESDVRLIDAAGQDLRLLFGDEQIMSKDGLPAHLEALADYCRNADIILFLINLKDFLGEGDPQQRTANEAAIKSAMDYLSGDDHPRRICLVLTQIDQYRELAKKYGGWLELTAKAVPYVFSAHVKAHQVAVHAVSSVAETQVIVSSDGMPQRVPAPGFRSKGLTDLIQWLTDQVRYAVREGNHTAPAQTLPATDVPPPLSWAELLTFHILMLCTPRTFSNRLKCDMRFAHAIGSIVVTNLLLAGLDLTLAGGKWTSMRDFALAQATLTVWRGLYAMGWAAVAYILLRLASCPAHEYRRVVIPLLYGSSTLLLLVAISGIAMQVDETIGIVIGLSSIAWVLISTTYVAVRVQKTAPIRTSMAVGVGGIAMLVVVIVVTAARASFIASQARESWNGVEDDHRYYDPDF